MAGERTPDQSPPGKPGSTDDEISLREHMQRQIDLLSWTTIRSNDARDAYFERVIKELRELLDERFRTQAKAIEKAEYASEKRFDGVNEFRDQLRDQAATFISKSEANVRMDSLAEKFEANTTRLNALELRISSRLDLNEGRTSGMDKAWGYLIAAVGLVGAVIAIVIAMKP